MLGIAKSTSTPTNHTSPCTIPRKVRFSLKMYEQLTLGICPNVNVTVSVFRAKVSQLLEGGVDSKTLEALSFLRSCGWLKFDTLKFYSQKMSKVYSTMMGGATFGTIIRTMDELGYDVEWQLLNSKYHGVPQNRERVFIVGHSRREPTEKVFPIEEASIEDSTDLKQIGMIDSHRHNPNRYRTYDPTGIAPTLDDMGGGGRQPMIIDTSYTGLDEGGRHGCTKK